MALRRSVWTLLALVWAAVVWLLLTLPAPPSLPSLLAPLPPLLQAMADKATHAALFLVQALLAHRALQPNGGGDRRHARTSLAVALALTLAYGLATELRQASVPGRDPSAGDLAADGGGGIAYAALLAASGRWRAAGARGGRPRRPDDPGDSTSAAS
jgi:VanZ family protein